VLKLPRFLELLGLNISKALSLKNYNRYRIDLKKFLTSGGIVTQKYPILDDFESQSGVASGHYFHQDLLVASFIFSKNPITHVDVGSRIDGFVAHVATFRKIEVIDIRSLKNFNHTNIQFKQLDLMQESHLISTDSLSCLHTIEHFGLGRYGDSIDPQGYIKGFNNLLKMLKPEGILYISFPIGKSNQVYFNAHRVFHPLDIFKWSPIPLDFVRFDYVDDVGDLHTDIDLINEIPEVNYGCGIYTVKKL